MDAEGWWGRRGLLGLGLHVDELLSLVLNPLDLLIQLHELQLHLQFSALLFEFVYLLLGLLGEVLLALCLASCHVLGS